MSKNKNKNAAPKSAKSVLMSVVPVISALVLIFVVGLVVVLVSNVNNKKPTFKGADDIYFEYADLTVTKDELYTNMKIQYGAAELIRLIDEKLYAKEIEATKTPEVEEELVLYILDSLFSLDAKEDLEQNEDNQKKWDELIDSLKMNNLISEEQIGTAADATKVTNFESTVWAIVKDHYRLQFARSTWARDAYVAQWKEDKLAENAKNEVELDNITIKELDEQFLEGIALNFCTEHGVEELLEMTLAEVLSLLELDANSTALNVLDQVTISEIVKMFESITADNEVVVME